MKFLVTGALRVAAMAAGLALCLQSQAAPPGGIGLTVAGRTTVMSAAALAAMPHVEATAFDSHEKRTHVHSGVRVRDLLEKAGIVFGDKLRGAALRQAVIVHCRDHYDIIFALAEFDPAFNSRTVLLVDSQDGGPVPERLGPYRLLIPGDARTARWAHQVTSFEVVTVSSKGP